MESSDEASKKKGGTNRAYLGNSQMFNELSNPCIKEQHLSRKCLEDNKYEKEPCEVYFVNYTRCRAFWNNIMKERRAKNIKPYLPLPEERADIKAKYTQSKR